jgi:hypothetical protein
MRKAVANAVAAVSVIGSLVALVYGLLGRGPGPAVLWIAIAYVALAFGLAVLWWEERSRVLKLEPIASAFKNSLVQRCDDVILEWRKLATLFQNAPKEEGDPRTLPEPMHPGWVSSTWKVWPYRVGVLQRGTSDLYNDFGRLIPIESYDARITLDELLDALTKARERFLKSSGGPI